MPTPVRDIRRKRFGRLVAIKRVPRRTASGRLESRYLCVCDCGETCMVERKHLMDGNTKSCGCLNAEMNKRRSWKGHGEISGTYWADLVRNAKYRGLDFGLTIQQAWDLFLSQQRRCALTAESLHFSVGRKGKKLKGNASLDRINNAWGYFPDNVRWVHKDVNRLKSDFSDEDLLRLCRKVVLGNGISAGCAVTERPGWEPWFMALCLVIAQRSLDPATKHGCIIVDDDNTILSVGYNSPPRGSQDSIIPLTRPEKYEYFVHSEEAAIANAARTGTAIKGGTAYITGHPCAKCLRAMINAGIKAIVYGGIGSACVDEMTKRVIHDLLRGRRGFVMRQATVDPLDVLGSAGAYFVGKTGTLPLPQTNDPTTTYRRAA